MTDDAIERLREAIESQRGRLRSEVPTDRAAATVAVVAAIDHQPGLAGSAATSLPDVVSGRRFASFGASRALQFCLEASDDVPMGSTPSSGTDLTRWSDQFLDDCEALATAETVLGHVESGFMRLADGRNGSVAAWRATKLTPAAWRERAHIDWWANWLDRTTDAAQRPQSVDDPVATMTYQFGYPPDAVLDGCSVQTYRDVLRCLLDRKIRDDVVPEANRVWSESELISSIVTGLELDGSVVARAISGFTVDRVSAAWHATVPGVAVAPLVRVEPDRLMASRLGLTTEPLFFLGRELRRRAAQEYHNSAWLREVSFRGDLRRVFGDRRFVVSPDRIELRRGKGDIRTDIDAVVFDRKTGTLGLFELKSQDPFSRSSEELERRRDNVLYANRQVSGVLDWLNRNSADDILRRLDERTAKTFRVQKVFPYVLARYLARFDDGASPDRRAAWGTWPDVLHGVDASTGQVAGANPIASLFGQLRTGSIPIPAVPSDARREVRVGPLQVVVYGSHDAMRGQVSD